MNDIPVKWKLLLWRPQNAVNLKSEDIRRIQKIIRNTVYLFFEDGLEVFKIQFYPVQRGPLTTHLRHQRLLFSQELGRQWGMLKWKFQKFRFRTSKLKTNFVSLVHFWICVSRPKLSLEKHDNCEKQTCENPAFSELFLRTACVKLLLEGNNISVARLKCVSVNVFLKSYG